MHFSHLVTLKLEPAKCVGCGLCVTVCPQRVLQMNEKKAEIVAKTRCIECGACMSNCPVGAVQVTAGVGCAQAIFNNGNCNC